MEKPLRGKVAIVSGAGSPIGLGLTMTLALVQAGARVAMLDIHETWLEQSAAQARAVGGDDAVLMLTADVSSLHDVEKAVNITIAELGGLDVLINNAGTHSRHAGYVSKEANFWDIPPETWDRLVAVNFSGPYYMARAVVGHMLAQGWGRIIGVTTSLDTMCREGGSPYGPSKAGHEALMALMAQELEGTGVTANVLIPGGPTDTYMVASDIDRSALIQREVMQGPAVWLASEALEGINGRRFIAYHWDESLPLEQRLEKASAPVAWPQLGKPTIFLKQPGESV